MPISPLPKRVAFSVTNCICYDQRVLKIAEAVKKLECEVTIIGRKLGNCCDSDLVPFKTKRFKMIFRKGFLFYKFFNIRLFIYLLFHKYDLLVANDLDTLLPNFLVSKLKHLPLVYDSHEYFTGVPELQNRPFVRMVWKVIEKSIFPHLRNVMTVSDSIALQYENEYHIRPATIRNCSKTTSGLSGFTRSELGINESDLLLILQGAGINMDRGGVELIEAVSRTKGVSLLIVGSGDVLDTVKRKVLELNISDQVKFIPLVERELLMRYTRSADVGLSLDKDTNLNYRFSLPNKLFDYIAAGIPVIAGELPEISKIVRENECGIMISSVSPENISKALSELRDNRGKLIVLRRNAVKASEILNWEIESVKVAEFYRDIIQCI